MLAAAAVELTQPEWLVLVERVVEETVVHQQLQPKEQTHLAAAAVLLSPEHLVKVVMVL